MVEIIFEIHATGFGLAILIQTQDVPDTYVMIPDITP